MNSAKTWTVGALTGALLTFAASAGAEAQKWDMPLAYAATNYHSQNAALFAAAVTEATGGELEVVPHPSGSLFKGGEIFRAVRTGQAPIPVLAKRGGIFTARHVPGLIKPGDCAALIAVPV